MSVRYNVVLSDDLNSAIDTIAVESETTKSDIMRKALQLYLAAHEGMQRGQKLGLANPETKQMETEFIGL
jgi:predicted transcriptional regulator